MEEQKIIEEGLKKNTKQDILCYIGMAIFFIMIFIPPIFRIAFADSKKETSKVEVVYLNLSCQKAVYRGGKKIATTINNSYKDSILQTSVMTYEYERDDDGEISEVNEFLALEYPEIKSEKLDNGYRFTFDYTNGNLLNKEELSEYNSPAPAQMNYYTTQQGYNCETQSEIKLEERK